MRRIVETREHPPSPRVGKASCYSPSPMGGGSEGSIVASSGSSGVWMQTWGEGTGAGPKDGGAEDPTSSCGGWGRGAENPTRRRILACASAGIGSDHRPLRRLIRGGGQARAHPRSRPHRSRDHPPWRRRVKATGSSHPPRERALDGISQTQRGVGDAQVARKCGQRNGARQDHPPRDRDHNGGAFKLRHWKCASGGHPCKRLVKQRESNPGSARTIHRMSGMQRVSKRSGSSPRAGEGQSLPRDPLQGARVIPARGGGLCFPSGSPPASGVIPARGGGTPRRPHAPDARADHPCARGRDTKVQRFLWKSAGSCPRAGSGRSPSASP